MAIGTTNTDPAQQVELNYVNVRMVGSGAFGVVRYAELHPSGEKVAVKKVYDDPRYRNRELPISKLMDHPNVVKLRYYYYSNTANGRFLHLIMDYIPDNLMGVMRRWRTPSGGPSARTVQKYSLQLFKALEYLHDVLNVCHRDIKPENILVDVASSVVKVCDFGSAKRLTQEANIAYICSRYYRAPELVMGVTDYTVAIDVWSVGCCVASMMFRVEPLFQGAGRYDQLVRIAKVLGTDKLHEYINKYQVELDSQFDAILGRYPRKPWEKFVHLDNQHLMTAGAIDFVDKLLCYDHADRLTAKQAIEHPYFNPIVSAQPNTPSQMSSRGGVVPTQTKQEQTGSKKRK